METYTIEVSSNILAIDGNPNAVLINEYIIDVQGSSNISCRYRRSFLDKHLKEVTIDLPIDVDIQSILPTLLDLQNYGKEYIREEWDALHFSECFAVDFSYESETYDIPFDSEIGKKISSVLDLKMSIKLSNKEIIKKIDI